MKEFNWERVESRRRSWEPANPKPNSEVCDFPDCEKMVQVLSRCLALTPLEPAVAKYLDEGIDRVDLFKVSDGAINTLRKNILDEERHEMALNRVASSWINYDASVEKEAEQIISAWDNNTSHPILKTFLLEQGVFMLILTAYSRFGGFSMRLASQDISLDEVRHASSNRAVSMLLGLKPDRLTFDLVEQTVRWVFDGLDHRGFDTDRMLLNSKKLLRSGKSDFNETAEGVVYAPFEIPKDTQSGYN